MDAAGDSFGWLGAPVTQMSSVRWPVEDSRASSPARRIVAFAHVGLVSFGREPPGCAFAGRPNLD